MFGSNFTKFLFFLKQQISFFFKFCISLQGHEIMTSLYYLAKILYTLRSLSKYKIGEILCKQSKVWSFALWWAPFVQIVYSFNQKSTEELSLMTLNSDPKLKEKLTFCLKNDMRNLMNFNLISEKSENLHFDGIASSKVCNIWAKII